MTEKIIRRKENTHLPGDREILRALLNNTGTQLVYLDTDFNMIEVNEAYVRASGHTREELIGRNHFDVFPNAENERIFRQVRDTGRRVEYKAKPFEYADQPWRGVTYWDWSLMPHKGPDDQMRGLVFSLVEVTDELKSARALQESEEWFRLITTSSPDTIFVQDRDLRYSFAVNSPHRNGGSETIGKTDFDLFPEEQARQLTALKKRVLETGTRQEIEAWLTVDGRQIWMAGKLEPWRDGDGNIIGVFGYAREETDRKRAEEERDRSLTEAKAAVLLRDEFLSVASHELKTPITSMLGFAQLLRRRLQQNKPVDLRYLNHSLEVIEQQSQKLAHLVSHLLDASRIDSGRLALEKEPVNICALLTKVVPSFKMRSGIHEITLDCPNELMVNLDSLRFEQVLVNLLDNAMKYSPNGGAIELKANLISPSSLEISIRDHGIGVPKGQQELIFTRFYQAHRSSSVSGMGLGLYISKQIVDLHGGHIRVESPEDGGARFVVTLPASNM